MNILTLTFLSEALVVSSLLLRGEIGFLQLVLFSQIWLIVVAVPFVLRSESRLDFFKGKWVCLGVFVLLVAVFVGAGTHLDQFGPYAKSDINPLSMFNELLPIFGVILAAAALLAGIILRDLE